MENIYVDLRNENKWIREAFDEADMVSVETILSKFEDLLDELENVKEEYEDFKRDVEDNFRRVDVSEQLDISDRDFI